jgi:Lysylphosphatidylglycerol synthase TM region
MRQRLLRAAAWLVTAALLAFLFKKIPFATVVAATRAAAPWTVPAAVASVFAIYFADSFAIWKTFGWFLAPLSFAQVLVVRGATYLLAAVNYNVGQGAIVYFVHRATGVPVMRGVATVLLIMGVNVLALLALTTVGLGVAPVVPHAILIVAGVAWAGLAVYALVVALRPRWLAERPLFDVLLSAGLKGHARALLVRVPHIATLVIYQTAMLRAFGVAVPVVQAIAALPIVFFIAVLPISVQGLGTTQAAMVFFFARYAPGDTQAQQAAVLAASIVSMAISLSLQTVLGLACLRSRVGRELQAATAATPNPGPVGG